MLTLATKASLLSHWSALAHAKGAFIVMSVGCFSTLALFFYASLVGPTPFSGYAPTWVASFLTISSTMLRFFLIGRGWAGVSKRELDNLGSHLRGAAQEDMNARQLSQDASRLLDANDGSGVEHPHKPERFIDEQVQASLLRTAMEQGFVSWRQVEDVLAHRFKSQPQIEWIFIGKGNEPLATASDWDMACSSASRLDARAPQVASRAPSRRL